MDIWERMYNAAKELYHPEEVSPFVNAYNVVAAIECENGEVFTGICIESCSGVLNICAERAAAVNMLINSKQTAVKRIIAFRNGHPSGGGSGVPCGACREFFLQLNPKNEETEILVDYSTRKTVRLKELIPLWWGDERYETKE